MRLVTMTTSRALRCLSVATLVLALGACGAPSGGDGSSGASSAAPSGAGVASGSTSGRSGDAAASPSATSVRPSASPEAAQAAELTQSFTTPDGSIGFRYPQGWTVGAPDASTPETRAWLLKDAEGATVLMLAIRPDGQIASPVTPTSTTSHGTLPGALDSHGDPVRIAEGPYPGQSAGANMLVAYGITSSTGADRLFGHLSRGDGTMVSFQVTQQGGINTSVDMAAEADAFSKSPRFREEILPVLSSFTMRPVGTTPAATAAPTGGTGACRGGSYEYSGLEGVDCAEATAILQEVESTGRPPAPAARRRTGTTASGPAQGRRAPAHRTCSAMRRPPGGTCSMRTCAEPARPSPSEGGATHEPWHTWMSFPRIS